jgi:hypothetical protein
MIERIKNIFRRKGEENYGRETITPEERKQIEDWQAANWAFIQNSGIGFGARRIEEHFYFDTEEDEGIKDKSMIRYFLFSHKPKDVSAVTDTVELSKGLKPRNKHDELYFASIWRDRHRSVQVQITGPYQSEFQFIKYGDKLYLRLFEFEALMMESEINLKDKRFPTIRGEIERKLDLDFRIKPSDEMIKPGSTTKY